MSANPFGPGIPARCHTSGTYLCLATRNTPGTCLQPAKEQTSDEEGSRVWGTYLTRCSTGVHLKGFIGGMVCPGHVPSVCLTCPRTRHYRQDFYTLVALHEQTRTDLAVRLLAECLPYRATYLRFRLQLGPNLRWAFVGTVLPTGFARIGREREEFPVGPGLYPLTLGGPVHRDYILPCHLTVCQSPVCRASGCRRSGSFRRPVHNAWRCRLGSLSNRTFNLDSSYHGSLHPVKGSLSVVTRVTLSTCLPHEGHISPGTPCAACEATIQT